MALSDAEAGARCAAAAAGCAVACPAPARHAPLAATAAAATTTDLLSRLNLSKGTFLRSHRFRIRTFCGPSG